MCDFGAVSGPMIAMGASMIATAASAALSIAGQQQQHSAQAQYQQRQVDANEAQMAENRQLATKAYLDQAVAANQSLSQTREATAESNFDTARQGMKARSEVIAASAEGGVNGVSLYAMLDDFNRQEAMFKSRNDTNLLFKEQQTTATIAAAKAQAEGRISQVKPYIPGPIKPVDYFGPALSVVQGGANTYMNFKAGADRGSRIRDSSGIF